MPSEVLEGYKTDSSGLKEFLDYHTASPKTCKCDFEDNKLMKSGIEGKKLRYTKPTWMLILYRVTQQVSNLGWGDFDFCCSILCLLLLMGN